MKTKYKKELLEPIIKESKSIAQVLKKLNLKPAGGNYFHIKRIISKFEIDISHFTGKGWCTEGFNKGRDIEEYLKNNYSISSYHLKNRLIKENILKEECSECGITEWRGKKISLELDHVDGDKFNNNLKNLRLLCPNCHSLTPNFRGRKIKN
jgi:hypothetical protein